jgi:hypothetical protein
VIESAGDTVTWVGGFGNVADTQLKGGPISPGPEFLICAGVYDELFQFYASSCPD